MKPYELYLLRHAKSDWETDAVTDFQRPLNKRGKKAARQIGEYLANKISGSILIVSSPALRAWQTAVTVSQALNVPEEEITFIGEIYMATAEELVNVLAKIPKNEKKVLLIGHNPGLEELLDFIVQDEIPETNDGKILTTAALAHVQLTQDWQHLDNGKGKLQELHRPRKKEMN